MRVKALVLAFILLIGGTAYADTYQTLPDDQMVLTEQDVSVEIGNLTESEYRDLLLTLNVEASSEDTLGKMMVLQVIMNRVKSHEWPDTIHGVISQKGQFCGYRLRKYGHITQAELDAVNLFCENQHNIFACWTDSPEDVIYFCTPKAYKAKGHQYMHDTFSYGGHVFGR